MHPLLWNPAVGRCIASSIAATAPHCRIGGCKRRDRKSPRSFQKPIISHALMRHTTPSVIASKVTSVVRAHCQAAYSSYPCALCRSPLSTTTSIWSVDGLLPLSRACHFCLRIERVGLRRDGEEARSIRYHEHVFTTAYCRIVRRVYGVTGVQHICQKYLALVPTMARIFPEPFLASWPRA